MCTKTNTQTRSEVRQLGILIVSTCCSTKACSVAGQKLLYYDLLGNVITLSAWVGSNWAPWFGVATITVTLTGGVHWSPSPLPQISL